MQKKDTRYKVPVFVGSAMIAATLSWWLRVRLQHACGDDDVLWIASVLAGVSVISMTQLLWYLLVEK